MSQPEFAAILDECVARLRQGEGPQSCLADYPAQAEALAPEVALTAELFQLSPLTPTPATVAEGYQQMMAALDERNERYRTAALLALLYRLVSPFRWRQRGLGTTLVRTAAIAVVVLVVTGGIAINAAADALPGDVLYPVKLTWEDTRLALTADESSRQSLQVEFERRRRDEVEALLDLRQPVIVEFKGVLAAMDAERWLVDGLEVTVTGDTSIEGAVTVGQRVSVRAQVREDGRLDALKIRGEEGPPTRPATRIPEPTATETRRPTATARADAPSPEPTISDRPTERPTRPSATPLPTDEPVPTRKPTERPKDEPTATDVPSIDNQPTREPHPTNTPSRDILGTPVPQPTETPVKDDPAPSPKPTDEPPPPEPTATPAPHRDPSPTHRPTATRPSDSGNQDHRPP